LVGLRNVLGSDSLLVGLRNVLGSGGSNPQRVSLRGYPDSGMEHLGTIFSFRDGLDHVPLYADLNIPLKGSFHTCYTEPGRNEWIVHDNGKFRQTVESLASDESDAQTPSKQQSLFTKFIQRWLYFQVLQEVLGHVPQFDISHFVREDEENAQWVSTEKLPEYLEKWFTLESIDPSVQRQVQAQLVLEKSQFFVSKYCASSGVERDAKPQWAIVPVVALSIMVLGETLTSAMRKILETTQSELRGWLNHDHRILGWGYSSAVLKVVRATGLCANRVFSLPGQLQNSSIGLLCASQVIPQAQDGLSHRLCNANKCNAKRFSLESGHHSKEPELYHCDSCKGDPCIPIGPNPEKLNDIIKKGAIPLLRYNREAGTVDLVEMGASFDKQYATFSHVWGDGFENPHANMLNQCVLDLFSELFTSIKNPNSLGAKQPKEFWIDTLAIPVKPEYQDQRKKAIRNMHRIYTGAKYTIVLDADLMRISRGSGYIKPAMSISVSRWMTRLWTLQEAFLSKHLFFKFSDTLYSMDRLENLFPDENAPLHSCVAYPSRSYYHGIMKKESRMMYGPDSTQKDRITKPEHLAVTWKALQWRKTAHPQHETLALATMFNVNTDEFLVPRSTTTGAEYSQEELDRRMQKLLDLLSVRDPCPIPPGIIFLPGSRLPIQGYRWAPRTWLSGSAVDPPDPLLLNASKARLNKHHGLEVKFPGFLLHRPPETNVFTDHEKFHFPTGLSLGEWYRVLRAEEEKNLTRSRTLAIIAPQLPPVNLKEIALLVAIVKKEANILFVEILHRVWINVESDPKALKELQRNFRTAQCGGMPCGELLSAEQIWCVDGPPVPQPVVTDEPHEDSPTFIGRILGSRSRTWGA
jgi:hypothetical protein